MSKNRHTLLLPFDSSTYPNPGPLLPVIFRALVSLPSSATHFTVFFATPRGEAFYKRLLASPKQHWADFQGFLAKVYACLGAAQWSSGNIPMDVEVAFQGEVGSGPDLKSETIVLEGYESLAASASTADPIRVIHSPHLRSSSPLRQVQPQAGPAVVALGGTFDHLHAAHKLLLHLALFLASRKLIVGVMADRLLAAKANSSLVQPLDHRIATIEEFLARRGATRTVEPDQVMMEVVEIHDGYGPTAWEEDIQALVISQETAAGGDAVNVKRREKGLSELELFTIEVIASTLEGGPAGQHMTPFDDDDEEDEDLEMQGRLHVKVGDEIKTLDLSGEKDEKRLKELKMGSTAIRQWIADRSAKKDQE